MDKEKSDLIIKRVQEVEQSGFGSVRIEVHGHKIRLIEKTTRDDMPNHIDK